MSSAINLIKVQDPIYYHREYKNDVPKEPKETRQLLSDLARSDQWEALSEAIAPEVHQLIKEWDALASDKRWELAGYAFGKADFATT